MAGSALESESSIGRLGRFNQVTNGFEDLCDLAVVVLKFAFQVFQSEGEFLLIREDFAEAHECSHDRDVHLHCPMAAQDTRKHRNPLLRKGVGQITAPASSGCAV